MNRLSKNKFIRDNLILLVVLGLVFPQYAFSDAWVADTGNHQISRVYKGGHTPTVVDVVEVGPTVVLGDTEIRVNINPTALFYPGLKLSFGRDREHVYGIQSIRFDDTAASDSWIIGFEDAFRDEGYIDEVADSPIYMELARSAGFQSPVSVSTNTYNTRVWIADDSINDSGITQLTGDGRDELSDTPLVTPYYTTEFQSGDTMFYLSSQDESIYPGIKIDFKSDNRQPDYVLEVKSIDKTGGTPPYILETTQGLPYNHSVIGSDVAVIHIDRFRDEIPVSPKGVSANSTFDRSDSEYDVAWAVAGDTVIKYEKWNYRRKLSIDPTNIGGNLTNFPLMVRLDSNRIDYNNTQDEGQDIRFADAQGNPLKYEIERWVEYDTSIVWVKVPEISSTDTTIMYMFYGNLQAQDAQDTENVWDEHYVMVQHMNNGSSDTNILDSTINNNDGIKKAGDEPIVAQGIIGNGQEFGGNDYISGMGEIGGISNSLTLSLWFKVKNYIPGFETIAGEGVPFAAPWTGAYSISVFSVPGSYVLYNWVTDQDGASRSSSYSLNSAQPFGWHHAALTVDATTVKLYLDGTQRGSQPWSGKNIQSGRDFVIGATDELGQYFDGIIDEIRISDIARPVAWVKASYYSGKDELIDFGDEENVRYGGILKVGGFDSPESISVNSSSGSVWVADTGDSEVVKLSKEGHRTINATVLGDYTIGEYQIALTDISELDSGINISFNGHTEDAYRVSINMPDDWWDARWIFRKPLILDKDDILGSGTLENFPVMVKLTPEWFDYQKSAPLGADVRFIDIDGNQLAHEIEEWVEDDTSIIWVKVPRIELESDTQIWLYFGYPQALDDQRPRDVWTNGYIMVQHLQQDPSGTAPQMLDSTIDSNDGTSVGMHSDNQVQGQIDGALEFDGVDSYVVVPDSGSLDIADAITLEAWTNPASAMWKYRKKITITGSAGAGTNYQVLLKVGESSGSSGANFDLDGGALNFPNDIRFTEDDGDTPLDHWLETVTGSSPNRTAYFWVEEADNLDTNQSIYIYYGKEGELSASNGANTFIFFDDFTGTSGTNIDNTKWTWVAGETCQYSNLHARSGTTGFRYSGAADTGGNPYHSFSPALSSAELIVYEYDTGVGTGIAEAMAGKHYAHCIGIYANTSAYYRYRNDGAYVNILSNPRSIGWHKLQMRGNGTTLYFLIDGTQATTTAVDAAFNRIYLGNSHPTPATIGYFDDCFVKKWIAAEPAFSSEGDVETLTNLIKKEGAYGIGTDEDAAFGTINDSLVSTPILSGWQHIALTYNRLQQRLYVDGELEISKTLTGEIDTNDSNLIIGSNFNGIIDEARISDVARSDTWIKASFVSERDEFIDYSGVLEGIGVTVEPALRNYVLNGSAVARELARISGFTNPSAVSVDSVLGHCWVIDGEDVVWLKNNIGEVDITTAAYNINTDIGYHRIITGFDNPVSLAVDPLTGNCWVACNTGNENSYIVRLDKDVPDGYALNGNRHIKIFGFDSPRAVSVDPSTGDCYIADGTDGGQVVRLSPEGHKYTGYQVDGSYSIGDTTIYLSLEDAESETNDTNLYIPLKISFGNFTTDIEPVYEIRNVEYDNDTDTAVIEIAPGGLEQTVSSGIRLNKELARVGGFDSPVALSAFEGENLEEGLHPWRLQVREFYVLDEEKIPSEIDDGWRSFPAHTPVHDATPQFRWKYLDVDGDNSPLQSYRIQIYTLDSSIQFVPIWDSGNLTVRNLGDIYPDGWIHTDWDIIATAIRENDSKSIYSADYGNFDADDCPDLSQTEEDNVDTGDKTYYVRLTVENENGSIEHYPLDIMEGQPLSAFENEAPYITFTLDKTPPGAYKVCGTQELVPSASNDNVDKNYYIKEHQTTPETVINEDYYQTDNYYWDEAWVAWEGGETEIIRESSVWIPRKQVTVRVKVKDKNNENPPLTDSELIPRKGYDGTTEFPEEPDNCSGISLKAQYRYSPASSPPPPNREWIGWFDCEEVRRYDEGAIMSNNQGERLLTGGLKNEFVWLYAKNVVFVDGDTNIIQFRVLDDGYMELSKIAENLLGDTAQIWLAPNMGYSHADTIIDEKFIRNVIYQTSSNTYGYKIPVDTDKPQVIVTEYPSNPYPHRFASFAWVAIDTTPCRFKYKLEYWDKVDRSWVIGGNSLSYADGQDFMEGMQGSTNPEYSYYSLYDNENWQTYGTDATSVSFDGLEVGRWYRFWVKAKDRDGTGDCGGAGEVSCSRRVSDDVVWVWYVSPEAPNTIITYGPSAEASGNIIFRWTGVGGMPPYTYDWKLHGLLFEDSQEDTAATYKSFGSNLPPGNYVFEVRVTDSIGNIDPTPAKRIFTVVNLSRPPYSDISPKNLYKYFREIGE